ncbi:coenzyme Q biosynthesis protein Coq4 [Emiliania huxleyi CCMP1516]|uniref:Ubiquinone biosynthesis protein COQ4 homolog, mitochondrial n=2 Tax=Emiliania huxleyi TaxID=2903 RepID=A0A0D3IQQ3_EMIH1|nr:coenzyme Q biosynthesis protein Coq4 [Emiliania huxleyi CCMP1516]EOD13588.1 coenzyme Q biosynthesis protein Coq4 [Emiliania huxleyi CCMP1516]|eukprot:XP_005766017.1 coenzyme Q biosynthesis protein Coq4 [Emiliania huxleyi CCMP1516]
MTLLTRGAGAARYSAHVPTTLLEKALIGSSSAVRALADPRQARLVGVVGETTGGAALHRLHRRMERHPVGRTVLQDRPLITSETLHAETLRAMPAGSFGAEYGAFLARHSFDPDERTAVHFVDDPELAYVMTRYRQVHDLWHVLYGLPPTFAGEVALKWLEAAQTGLPMCAAGALAGGVRLTAAQRRAVVRSVLPWAARHALRGPARPAPPTGLNPHWV